VFYVANQRRFAAGHRGLNLRRVGLAKVQPNYIIPGAH